MYPFNQLSAVSELTDTPEWDVGIKEIADKYISIHEYCLSQFPAYEPSKTDVTQGNDDDFRTIKPVFFSRRGHSYLTAGYIQLNLKHREGPRNIYAVSIIPYDKPMITSLAHHVPPSHLTSILLLETGVLQTMHLNHEKQVVTMSSFYPPRMRGYAARPYPADFKQLRTQMINDLAEPYTNLFEETIKTADLALHAQKIFVTKTENKESLVEYL